MTNRTKRRALWVSASWILGALCVTGMPTLAATSVEVAERETVSLSDAQDGSLLLHTDLPGRFIKAPMVATDVDISVAGSIIRTQLTQTFENNTQDWVEGIYVFPLPEMAAVDRLKMVVGGRLIEGQVKEKAQAKHIYETAKSEGKKASLVTQERPNIFTTSVANIGPGESVSIQIEYQDKVRIQDGEFSLRFPMTVAPRYSPPREMVQLANADGNVSVAILDPVLDRNRITPPLTAPTDEPIDYLRLPVTVDVKLQAGFPIETIDSPYHNVAVNRDGNSVQISLRDGPVPANKDFKLEWSAQPTSVPYSAIFTEQADGETFLLAMLTPPRNELEVEVQGRARESIFVIDTSGSMGGQSMSQARKALTLAVERLTPEDKFNIVRFASTHDTLFNEPVPATEANIRRAMRYINGLKAKGGTEMLPALTTALTMKRENEAAFRQIIFITDGSIGNETQMFAELKHELGDARFFPVGIGSAPNSHFMSRAAKFGRGTYVQIGKVSEVNKRMGKLFKAIENPILTDIVGDFPDGAEIYPSVFPDLYDGEPVMVAAKLPNGTIPDRLKLSGQLSGQNWSMTTNLNTADMADGIRTLWARQKIADLEDQRFDRSVAGGIDATILKTALKYQLVSRLTSLVAVDVTPSRPMSEGVTRETVPTMLPEGWDFAALTMAENNPRAPRPPSAVTQKPVMKTVSVPATASVHNFLMLLGMLVLLMFGVLRARQRRA